jgi:hypothetical protein
LTVITLRRAGSFDPVQFFRVRLIQINSFPANLAQDDQYWAGEGGKTFHNARNIVSASSETECFDVRRFVASATIVAKMSRPREFRFRRSYCLGRAS